jgi:hypothetical protein
MVEAMLQLSVVEALAAELRSRRELNVSHQIDEMIRITRASIGIRCDLDPARRFLAELEKNPEAELLDLGSPAIETLEVPIMRPLEDGSIYVNRGPAEEVSEPVVPMLDPMTDADAAARAFWQSPQRAALMRVEAGLVEMIQAQPRATIQGLLHCRKVPFRCLSWFRCRT